MLMTRAPILAECTIAIAIVWTSPAFRRRTGSGSPKALTGLNDTADGKEVLKTVGIQGFDTGTQKPLGELLGWLGL